MEFNPLLQRYVPAMAAFLRQTEVPFFHVKYEDLVKDPEKWMEQIYGYIGVPFEQDTINYGEKKRDPEAAKGLGDPIGVAKHSRPSTASLSKWVEELTTDTAKRALMEKTIQSLDPADLETLGYPADTIWKPMEEAAGKTITPKSQPMTRYRLQRKAIIQLRGLAQRSGAVRGVLKKVRLATDVLLRE
jgi:hypothetical protein